MGDKLDRIQRLRYMRKTGWVLLCVSPLLAAKQGCGEDWTSPWCPFPTEGGRAPSPSLPIVLLPLLSEWMVVAKVTRRARPFLFPR